MATYNAKQLRALIKSLSFTDNGKVAVIVGEVGDDEYQIVGIEDGALKVTGDMAVMESVPPWRFHHPATPFDMTTLC